VNTLFKEEVPTWKSNCILNIPPAEATSKPRSPFCSTLALVMTTFYPESFLLCQKDSGVSAVTTELKIGGHSLSNVIKVLIMPGFLIVADLELVHSLNVVTESKIQQRNATRLRPKQLAAIADPTAFCQNAETEFWTAKHPISNNVMMQI